MRTQISTLFLAAISTTVAASPLDVRTVTSLNTAAFEEAHVRDATATRAFANTEIKTNDGRCLSVDELSGDFRANLNPIQVSSCNGSTGQLWDIITKGVHNDQAGTMLIVNTLTQACANFDPRRAAGNQVIMFSCGGRADGGGSVTNSQLFPFKTSQRTGPLAFAPVGGKNVCLVVKGDVLDQTNCDKTDANQAFTFGNGTDSASTALPVTEVISTTAPSQASETEDCVTSTTWVTVTVDPTLSPFSAPLPTLIVSSTPRPFSPSPNTSRRFSNSSSTISSTSASSITAVPVPIVANPTTPVPVSRAGGTLDPSAAALAQARDNTATRALVAVNIKDSTGACLTIDPTAGDFRENLIPITLSPCTGSPAQAFDFITLGIHNNVANTTLIVSSLMNGCVNLDLRRAVGDQVIMFSCGGRADGDSTTTASQLFPFTPGTSSMALANVGAKGTCLVNAGGKLDQAACDGGKGQVFTLG